LAFSTPALTLASTISGLALKSGDVFLTASSLSHEGGVGFSFAALAAGASVVIARNFDPDEYLPLLRQTKPTVMWILPAALYRLVEEQGATHDDFASLRYCAAGGDKLPAPLEAEFEELAGFEIHETYGMTETGSITANPPQDVEDALFAHPSVAAAGVVGVHNLYHGENLRAYVTLHPGSLQTTASELIVFTRNSIGYKAPEEVFFLDEMPLGPTGKTDRTTLKKWRRRRPSAEPGSAGAHWQGDSNSQCLYIVFFVKTLGT
jgi:acyl-CoA synthetase (AMP-forming)/AMP-acid ligase II